MEAVVEVTWEAIREVAGEATAVLQLRAAPGWAHGPDIWLRGTVAAWPPGLVVPADGIAFITVTSCIATGAFSSWAGRGGAVTATTTPVVGSGSRLDGVRNGSGSAATITEPTFPPGGLDVR